MFNDDLQIQQAVIAALSAEPTVNATHIGVEVRQAVVTLSGLVDSYAEKWHAERTVQALAGVKALVNDINIERVGPHFTADDDVTKAVKNVLEWNVFIPQNCITVKVESGWVTLTGEVYADYQRRLAHSSIRYLSGIIGVIDHLIIKPSVQGKLLKAEIEAMLQQRASREARGIDVSITEHAVTLKGKVYSLAERNLINRVVWDFPGVWAVSNQIEIAA